MNNLGMQFIETQRAMQLECFRQCMISHRQAVIATLKALGNIKEIIPKRALRHDCIYVTLSE